MYSIEIKDILRSLLVTSMVFLFASLALSETHAQPSAQKKPVVHICAAEGHPIHLMVANTLRQAYRHIGYDVDFTWLPNKRSLMTANTGDCAGEMMRIKGLEAKFENLIPVPTTVTTLEGVAFMNKRFSPNAPPVQSWDDLKNLKTYIILGEVYAERGTQGMNVGTVSTYSQLFTMLSRNHMDVAIGIREVGLMELARGFRNSKIEINSAPLVRVPMYHFVHREYAHLIPKLQAVLQKMDDLGEIKTLNERSLERMLKNP